MRRKDILDKIFEKMVYHLGCYGEESNVAPIDRDRFMKALCDEIGFNYTWKPVWVPVTERLPEEGNRYIIYHESFGIRIDTRTNGEWKTYGDDTVLAWMPLPDQYSMEGDK